MSWEIKLQDSICDGHKSVINLKHDFRNPYFILSIRQDTNSGEDDVTATACLTQENVAKLRGILDDWTLLKSYTEGMNLEFR